MNWKILAFLALSIGPLEAEGPISMDQDCAFNVVQNAPPPEIIGSDDVTSRTKVVNETGSPVVIVRVDVSESGREKNPQGLIAIGGTYRIEIQNVSDHVIDEISLGVHRRLKANAGWSGGTRSTTLALAPGQLVELRQAGRTESAEAVTDEARLQAMVSIEFVRLAGCTYRPKLQWYAEEFRFLP